MSSQRKIDSSRANGAKSHGPKTPEGRQQSSQNSLKHGLTAAALIVDGENHDDFQALVDTVVTHFQPQDDFELDLVLEIAHLRWRLRRVAAIETGIYDDQQSVIEDLSPDYADQAPHVRTARIYSSAGKAIDLLSRYESRLNRRYQQTVATFLRLRATKPQPAAEVGQASRPVEKNEPNPTTAHQDYTKPTLDDIPEPRKPAAAAQPARRIIKAR